MTKIPSFSIIVPNLNGAHFLPDCLNSLLESINKEGLKYEIIFVDNGSKDESLKVFKEIVSKNKIDHQIIKNNCNCGFAKAVNQGISLAKHDWVILLNNDVTIKTDWFEIISKQISKLEDSSTAAIFGTVLNKTGEKFESTGLKFYYRGKAENIDNQKDFDVKIIKKEPEFAWGASAALVVYSKQILTHIGMFDEDFFAYEEDVDVALRLHNLKYKTLYVPQAICHHLGGGTSNKMGNFRSKMALRNWILLILKNYPIKIFIKNFFQITIERLRNLNYFIKDSYKTYSIFSIFSIPIELLIIIFQLIIKIPNILKSRKQIFKLNNYLTI